jgi:excisionase family DNA binding protein
LPIIGGIELATLITGLKKSTIYKLTSEGKIPYEKLGGKLRFMTAGPYSLGKKEFY